MLAFNFRLADGPEESKRTRNHSFNSVIIPVLPHKAVAEDSKIGNL
jgi:hypothetical protein